MKTPDEIKKGLECCINDSCGCNEQCPYFNSLSNGVDCAVKMHGDALAYIQQLEAKVPRWISVEERVPPDGKAVLVVLRNSDMEVQWVEVGIRWHGQWNDVERFIVTHWMPLPEPPVEV